MYGLLFTYSAQLSGYRQVRSATTSKNCSRQAFSPGSIHTLFHSFIYSCQCLELTTQCTSRERRLST